MAEPFALHEQQRRASDPEAHRWVAASAGTGKTQVLSARVLRLLLAGARPESILCLTFTRAGAAEMQGRVNGKLAKWVRLGETALFHELSAIGEDGGPETRAKARHLFARVLDAGGGGLQVQTIHGFCQSLLATFPLESGLTPGFRLMDEGERERLATHTLADLLTAYDATLAERIGRLSVRLGEEGARRFLNSCASAAGTLARLPGDLLPWLRLAAGFTGSTRDTMLTGVSDEAFPVATARRLTDAMSGGSKGVAACGLVLSDWLSHGPEGRLDRLDELASALMTKQGAPKSLYKLPDAVPEVSEWQTTVCDAVSAVLGWRALAAYLEELADGLEAGRTFADAFEEAKRAAGLVDYDDLIRDAAALLTQPAMGAWVRYKLDERIDHILVDEAQDTNARQWAVVEALADEFFASHEEDEPVTRTVFAVGDFKQAIFGFQGTDPAAFSAARARLSERADEVATPFGDVALTRSFRSTPAILSLVDAVVERLGAGAMGLEGARNRHESATGGPGEVILAEPVAGASSDEDAEEEGWLGDADRRLAEAIARQVRVWINAELPVGNPPRPVTPGDVLVLVRSRGPYVPFIVARLHEEGVPVAGVDRLTLSGPLVVQDLLAAVRWVLQPEDDLALASLLVSPLIGWSQDELMAATERSPGMSLWRHLRETRDAGELAPLYDLLARADYEPPYQFLERILSGPLAGRAKLLARLGEEARDPLEELLTAAVTFEATEPPGLQRFLRWIEGSNSEIKREAAAAGDAVRVLTVHGAKGLEAPIVILADATRRAAGPVGGFTWRLSDDLHLPALRPAKEERVGPLAEAMAADEARDAAEHQRLLYVALTRARERLLVVGKAPGRGSLDPASWHAAVANGLADLPTEEDDDPIWGRVVRYTDDTPWTMEGKPAGNGERGGREPEPGWLRRAAPPEARPPRPLVPSRLGADDAASRPLGPARAEAIARGVRLHALFERLPPVAPERRREAGRRWLLSRPGMDQAHADALIDAALEVIERPEWARLWGDDALAEAPISAIVEGDVVTGAIDRLVIGADAIEVVDFKTGLAIPTSAEAAPAAYLRQMAAYRGALRVLFPGRPVRAALLYTAGPLWLDLPDELLDRHKPGAKWKERPDNNP